MQTNELNKRGRSRDRARRAQVGFTLVELMVVISIIAILATIVGVNLSDSIDKGNVAAAQAQIKNFQNALISYKLEHKKFPDQLDDIKEFLDPQQIPLDPWDNQYVYTRDGSKYTIVCYGADGSPGGSDFDADISSDNLKGD